MSPIALTALSTEPDFFVPRLLAAWEAGDAVLPIDHRLPAAETKSLLDQLRPTRFHRPGGSIELADPQPIHPDTFLIVATSGTTGRPKGVQLSRDALIASAGASEQWLAKGPQRWLCCLSLAHIAGLSTVIRSHLAGFEAVVHERFDPAMVAESASRSEADAISIVPTMLERLLTHGAPLDRFKTVLVGGGPIPKDLLEYARSRGVSVTATYGMTETCGGCVYDGWPLPDIEVRVREQEIQIKGPVVMTSYLGGNVQPFTEEGWLATNDIGEISADGHLTVLGRADDVIITGGHNVAPVEVEAALTSHERIRDAAVVGLPDATWGTGVVALIVIEGDRLDPAQLKQHLSRIISSYKIPKRYLLTDEIPRSAGGKILRDQAALLAAALDRKPEAFQSDAGDTS